MLPSNPTRASPQMHLVMRGTRGRKPPRPSRQQGKQDVSGLISGTVTQAPTWGWVLNQMYSNGPAKCYQAMPSHWKETDGGTTLILNQSQLVSNITWTERQSWACVLGNCSSLNSRSHASPVGVLGFLLLHSMFKREPQKSGWKRLCNFSSLSLK